MEFSPLELVKLNSANPSKQASFEGNTPFVPFVNFLQLEGAEPGHEESQRADIEIDPREPVKRTDEEQRQEPAPRSEYNEEASDENRDLPSRDEENASSSSKNETESSSEPEDGEGVVENAPETGKALNPADGRATTNPNVEPQVFTLSETEPELLSLIQGETTTSKAPVILNLAPSTGPIVMAEEGIEDATLVKAAMPKAGVNATGGTLLSEDPMVATGGNPMPAGDPRLAAGNVALLPEGKPDVTMKTAGPIAFNAEGEDGCTQTQPGQAGNSQSIVNGTKPVSQAPAPNPAPVMPSAGMELGISSVAPTITAAPTSEAPLGGLSPLNTGDVTAARTSGLTLPMQGRAPAATPPLIDQVAGTMKQAADEGRSRIRIQLKPSALGQIDVNMEIAKDGKVMAVISVERPETFELLQRDARALERALLESGLRTDSNSLNFQLRGQENGQTAEHLPGSDTPADGSDELTGDTEMTAAEDYDTWIVGDGIVDIHV